MGWTDFEGADEDVSQGLSKQAHTHHIFVQVVPLTWDQAQADPQEEVPVPRK